MAMQRFFLGLVMLVAGGYLFFDNIIVSNSFSFGYSVYRTGGVNLTTGMLFIPFIFGIGMIFYNPDNDLGWILALITLVLLLFGVISSLQIHMRTMSAFNLMMILGLFIGGLGLFLSAFRRPK